MAKQMSRADLEAELRLLRRNKTSEGYVQVLKTLIKYAAFVLIARYAYFGIEALAGKVTFADIGVNFLSKAEVSVTLSITVGIIGGLYGLIQRKLRKDTVETLQARNQELELIIDGRRSSSELTIRGDTRPEDKI